VVLSKVIITQQICALTERRAMPLYTLCETCGGRDTYLPSAPQVMVPQKPPLSLTVTWALPHHPKDPSAPDTPFWRCLQDFLDGDDAVRANIFKLIPRRDCPVYSTALINSFEMPEALRANIFKLIPRRGRHSHSTAFIDSSKSSEL